MFPVIGALIVMNFENSVKVEKIVVVGRIDLRSMIKGISVINFNSYEPDSFPFIPDKRQNIKSKQESY